MGRAAGLDQIVGGAAILPTPNCTLVVRSAQIGEIELTVAAARRMVTSIGIVLRADGGIDIAQLLTPLHLDSAAVAEYARRSLLGQWLYRSGELASSGVRASDQLREILTGEAFDPVLSLLAYHDLSRLSRQGVSVGSFLDQVGYRIVSESPEHVDSAVIAN